MTNACTRPYNARRHERHICLTPGALADLRVLELGTLIAGPFCGQLLGDMGAEVIKIEAPGQGDPMRHWGPQPRGEPSVWWPVIGRNKKGITLDLRQDEGQSLFKELVRKADVVIENFRPGTLEKWNCGWTELSALNPRLILVRVSGYGQTGPYSQRAGYGGIGEAMGGLRYIVGEPDRPPSRVGISIGDSLAAVHACMGTLAALHHRDRTGAGQVVDAAIYESVLNMMESLVTEYDQLGHVRERSGPILPRIAPSNVYPTRDGIVMIGANQDTVFARLASAMEAPALAQDPRYADHQARGANQAELDAIIARWTATLATRDLLALLERHGDSFGPDLPRRRHARRSALRGTRSHRQHDASAVRHAAHAERGTAPVGESEFGSQRPPPRSASTTRKSTASFWASGPMFSTATAPAA